MEDLQALSDVCTADETVDEIKAGEGAPFSQFKTKYPKLFDCLYSVFGNMLSNSRLCEQIHGMMWHALRKEIGIDEVDQQRIYMSGIAHKMNEERQNMISATIEHRDKHKTAVKHSRIKDQLLRLSEQLAERGDKFATMMQYSSWDQSVSSITTINGLGRRVMDQENLNNQMKEEGLKAGGLCRKQLTS